MIYFFRQKLPRTIVSTLAAALLMSCNGNRQAKGIVTQFLDNNLKDADYSAEYFSKVDSTFVISDSVLNDMRTKANQTGLFKSLKFGERGNSRKLNYIRVRYILGNDTIKQTFYLDASTTCVVALKQDV